MRIGQAAVTDTDSLGSKNACGSQGLGMEAHTGGGSPGVISPYRVMM